MEVLKSFPSLIFVSATMFVIFSVLSVEAQIGTPCTASMITGFTSCINFITGSSGNGASPTTGCCDTVKSLMSGSMDCVCLIVTGNVPLPLPINRTLALSLPRACKSNVPIQCKSSGVPLPAPGPVLFAPPISPISSLSPVAAPSPFSPRASKASSSAAAEPPAETPTQVPASPPAHSVAPTSAIRPVVTPTSASNPSYILSPYVLLIFMGIAIFKCY